MENVVRLSASTLVNRLESYENYRMGKRQLFLELMKELGKKLLQKIISEKVLIEENFEEFDSTRLSIDVCVLTPRELDRLLAEARDKGMLYARQKTIGDENAKYKNPIK